MRSIIIGARWWAITAGLLCAVALFFGTLINGCLARRQFERAHEVCKDRFSYVGVWDAEKIECPRADQVLTIARAEDAFNAYKIYCTCPKR